MPRVIIFSVECRILANLGNCRYESRRCLRANFRPVKRCGVTRDPTLCVRLCWKLSDIVDLGTIFGCIAAPFPRIASRHFGDSYELVGDAVGNRRSSSYP
jgi:hypothetical protein